MRDNGLREGASREADNISLDGLTFDELIGDKGRARVLWAQRSVIREDTLDKIAEVTVHNLNTND